MLRRTLNLGILAHVDAGKTTLTERLLYAAGAAAHVRGLRRQPPALTRGEGVLECAFESYRAVNGAIPARARSDRNPPTARNTCFASREAGDKP